MQDATRQIGQKYVASSRRTQIRASSGNACGDRNGEMRGRGANLFHIRGGKVKRLVLYWDRERAFADLGLAPEAAVIERTDSDVTGELDGDCSRSGLFLDFVGKP